MSSSTWQDKVLGDWTCDDISCWLQGIGQAGVAKKFKEQQIDGKALVLLREQDVKEILEQDSVGTRVKVWNEIEQLQIPQKHNNSSKKRHGNENALENGRNERQVELQLSIEFKAIEQQWEKLKKEFEIVENIDTWEKEKRGGQNLDVEILNA